MGLRSILRATIEAFLGPSDARDPQPWFRDFMLGGRESEAGVVVNTRSALSYAPMHNAVARISGHLGVMPLVIKRCDYETGSYETVDPRDNPQQKLLALTPNELTDAQQFKETVSLHAILAGNGRAFILRDGNEIPRQLYVVQPEQTWISIEYRGGEPVQKLHHVTTADGNFVTIPDADMLHVMGLSPDGFGGYPLFELAREAIGGGLAAELLQNRVFEFDAMPGLLLQAPPGKMLSEDKRKEFLQKFEAWHRKTQGRVGMLPDGMTAEILQQNSRDGDWLNYRRLAREDTALFTGVENMLGVESSVSYNSLEQRNQGYLTNCLSRWITKWEQQATRKLLTQRQQDLGLCYKFETHKLLQGSISERVSTYQVGRTVGLWSQEEIRAIEGLPPPDPSHNFSNPNTTPAAGGTRSENADGASASDAQAAGVASGANGNGQA